MISSRQLSIRINEVLDHLCVNDEMIKIRRKSFLQLECVETMLASISTERTVFGDAFYFGSQSEGSTTLGLHSDIDSACILHKVVVITDKDDHVSEDKYTFRMEKFTNKGYCCLRDISHSKNTDLVKYLQQSFTQHYREGYFLKNSFLILGSFVPKSEREGPALRYQLRGQDSSLIQGFYCSSWPREVSNTFQLNQEKLCWPSDRLFQDVLQTRCFVVPKGSDTGPDSDIEWRLSFSLGERLLMFDLNIVQIRCYVLMKYVKITFLDNLLDCKGIICSYICKTVLLHTVSQTNKSEWVEDHLLHNLKHCLCNLRMFISQKNCPHFIMPLNNLLANKLNEATRVRLLDELKRIIDSNECLLFDIKVDNFGELLKGNHVLNSMKEDGATLCSGFLKMLVQAFHVSKLKAGFLNEEVYVYKEMMKWLLELYHSTSVSDEIMQNVVIVNVGILSTLTGSLIASDDIKYRHDLSDKAFQWFLLGMMCTDQASAYLKLASILFLIGDFHSTYSLLKCIRKKLDECIHGQVHACICKGTLSFIVTFDEFQSQSILKKSFSDLVRRHITSCVIYSPGEINCCPKELQYEFFRAAFNEIPQGHWGDNYWLSCAILPQVPFCNFLLYKFYKKLGIEVKCRRTLEEFTKTPTIVALCGKHLETIYNLIGQCMEQEGRFYLALYYYYKSLQVEPTYNAAKILICCNLFQQFHRDRMS